MESGSDVTPTMTINHFALAGLAEAAALAKHAIAFIGAIVPAAFALAGFSLPEMLAEPGIPFVGAAASPGRALAAALVKLADAAPVARANMLVETNVM